MLARRASGTEIDVARQTDLVDRQDLTGLLRSLAGDVSRIDVVGRGVDLGEYRVASVCLTTLTLAMNVSESTITSSPGPMPRACSPRKPPVVPLDTPTAS